MSFEKADYREFSGGTFDLIYSWCVLHFIPGPDNLLFGKLARDLNDDGLLLYTLPYDCLFNRCLSAGRKVCRALRFRWLDRLFFQLARATRLWGPGFLTRAAARTPPRIHVPAGASQRQPSR